MAQALEAEGHHGVASVVKLLDAVDPLVTVEHSTSLDAVIAREGTDNPAGWLELRAVFGQDEVASAPEADALPAPSG